MAVKNMNGAGKPATARIFGARRRLAVVLCGLMAWCSSASAQQPPAASPQSSASGDAVAMIVLDGSNSMNGRLPNDKALKHVTVRDALQATLPSLSRRTEVGLVTFGARRSSDCTDVEVGVPPSSDTSRVTAALERFQPRGFSPVVLAMRTAAKALPQRPGKTSMVLVLDDLASCRGEDPCAVAGELKRQNPALTIHVVGLGLKRPDAQVLTCVARETGGLLFDAADGPSVGPAIEEVMKLIGTAAVPVAAKTAAATEAAAAPLTPAVPRAAVRPGDRAGAQGAPGPVLIDETQPGIHFAARLAEGKPLIGVPLRWRVWSDAEPEGAPAVPGSPSSGPVAGVPVLDVTASAVTRRLPEGRYRLEVSGGLVTVRRRFEVTGPGPTRVPVALDAALLKIAARHAGRGEAVSDGLVTVSGGGETRDQRLTPLWITRGGGGDLIVPPGAYRISAETGLASGERAVAIAAGLVTEVDVELATGRIVVEEANSAVQQNGPAHFIVEADDPDSARGRRELFRAAQSRLELTLPAGTYLVTLQRGEAQVRERFVVKAGETTSRVMTIPIARVRLVGRMGAAGVPAGDALYRIERLEGATRIVQRWGEAEPVIDLTPGRYRFEARIGGQNAVVTREAEIKAGFEHRIELDTGAGGVQLKLSPAKAGLGLGDVYWHIVDDRGETVWRTVEADPKLALRAGRYRVRAEVRDRDVERVIEVRAGESGVYEIGD